MGGGTPVPGVFGSIEDSESVMNSASCCKAFFTVNLYTAAFGVQRSAFSVQRSRFAGRSHIRNIITILADGPIGP